MSGKDSERNIFDVRLRIFLSTAVIGLLLIMTGCVKNRFKMDFALPDSINNAYSLTYYASDSRGGRYIETAISVQKGKGMAELPVKNPSLISLKAGNIYIYIYAERGDNIKVSGSTVNPYEWDVTGNALNERWSRWRKDNKAVLNGGDPEKINRAISEYVRKNPSDPLSTLLLLCRYDRRADNSGFLAAWHLLKDDAAMEKWISLPGRNDIMTNSPLEEFDNKRPVSFVLKSLENGADTITTGKVPVVLCFWRNSDTRRKEFIDSLRALRKEHPDSDKFIIADICFDTDSMSWTAPLRRDSLKGVIRAWTPLAENDSVSRIFGIERTPRIVTIKPIKK